MLAYIEGQVVYSDGKEAIIQTTSGLGHQMTYNGHLLEGNRVALYMSQIIKENAHDLYAFDSLKEKKMFELLLTINGVGGKSAYPLVRSLGVDTLIRSIMFEDKKTLKSAPGIGDKAASRLIMELKKKVSELEIYKTDTPEVDSVTKQQVLVEPPKKEDKRTDHIIFQEAIQALSQLGFHEDKVIPVIREIIELNSPGRSEELVHMALKQLG